MVCAVNPFQSPNKGWELSLGVCLGSQHICLPDTVGAMIHILRIIELSHNRNALVRRDCSKPTNEELDRIPNHCAHW